MPETEIGPAAVKRIAHARGIKLSNKDCLHVISYVQRNIGPVLAATVETYLRRVYSDITGETATHNIMKEQAA